MLTLMALVPLTGMQCWKWGGGKLIDVWDGKFGKNSRIIKYLIFSRMG